MNGGKNNGEPIPSDDTSAGEVAPSTEAGQSQDAAPEGGAESTAGTATGEENKPAEDNTAGTATL